MMMIYSILKSILRTWNLALGKPKNTGSLLLRLPGSLVVFGYNHKQHQYNSLAEMGIKLFSNSISYISCFCRILEAFNGLYFLGVTLDSREPSLRRLYCNAVWFYTLGV